MGHEVHIVDVFAPSPSSRWQGNPLAVVPDGGALSSDEMQAIAREMNLSETTFVVGTNDDGSHRVRIFTPSEEMPFAGHPTLGTAWLLRSLGTGSAEEVVLDLAVGPVPVTFAPGPVGELAWLTAPPVKLGPLAKPELVAEALGLAPGDLDPAAPPRLVEGGPAFVFARVLRAEALEGSRLDASAFAPLAEQGFPCCVHVSCRETREAESDLDARMFFDAGGIREDPATGSATAFLGAYLLEHGGFGEGSVAIRIEQGHAMQRTSHLHLRAEHGVKNDHIRVGGIVVAALCGELAR